MIQPSTRLDIVLVILWFVWAAILVGFRVNYGRLGQELAAANSADWERLRFQDGTLDVLEPIRWYLRVRRFVQQVPLGAAQTADIRGRMRRMKRMFEAIEIGFVVLVVAIGAVVVHNVFTGAYHPR